MILNILSTGFTQQELMRFLRRPSQEDVSHLDLHSDLSESKVTKKTESGVGAPDAHITESIGFNY